MSRSEAPAMLVRGRAAGVLAVLALVASVVAVYAACGGQFRLDWGAIRISLRSPFNPTIAAVLAASLAWTLDRHSAARACARARTFVDWSAPGMAALVAAATLTTAAAYGSFVAGGSDSSGYLNQARVWQNLTFHAPHPLTDVSWTHRANILSPLGFRPATELGAIVPLYPPGFPILIAAAERLGPERAGFLVVPFAGAATVLLAFAVAHRFGGALAGFAAATLTATSPIFRFLLLQPMSDVPATCLWTLAFCLLMSASKWPTVLGGVAAGCAGLVRPNLFVLGLAAVPVAAWWRSRAQSPWTRSLLFASGLLPSVVAFVLWGRFLYGTAGQTGYGDFTTLLAFDRVWANLTRYADWLIALEPIVFFAPVALLVLPRTDAGSRFTWRAANAILFFFALLLGFYLLYTVFDDWPYLRFLLPGIPLLIALSAASFVSLVDRLGRAAGLAATLLLVTALGTMNVQASVRQGAFAIADGERRFEHAGRWLLEHTPPRAAVVSMLHSGSARYYASRLTLRWDWIEPADMAVVIRDLHSRGYPPWLVLDAAERDAFAARHPDALAALDGHQPAAQFGEPPSVWIYDLAPLQGAATQPRPAGAPSAHTPSGPTPARASPAVPPAARQLATAVCASKSAYACSTRSRMRSCAAALPSGRSSAKLRRSPLTT